MQIRQTSNQSVNRKKRNHLSCSLRGRGVGLPAAMLGAALLLGPGRVSAEWTDEPQVPDAATHTVAAEATTDSENARRILFLRPHAGVGWASGYNRSGNALALHAGGRLLFPAPLSPKVAATFGLEATYLQLDITGRDIFSERYAVVGVVLEMTVVKGFNLGIGTLGYIGIGANDRNPFGVVTNLGWEPMWDSRVRPYITLRTEWIFDQATYNVMSLSAGITFGI